MAFIVNISNTDIFESPNYLDFSGVACLHFEPVIHLQAIWNEHQCNTKHLQCTQLCKAAVWQPIADCLLNYNEVLKFNTTDTSQVHINVDIQVQNILDSLL